METDPLVEEMRANGRKFAAKHGNDIGRMCKALKKLEALSGRAVVDRDPKRLQRKAAG